MLMSVKALVGISSFFWLLLLLRRMMKYVKDQFVSSFYRFFPVFFFHSASFARYNAFHQFVRNKWHKENIQKRFL